MSKRNYITKASLESVMGASYANVTDEQIDLAEEIIDSIVYTEIDNALAPYLQNRKVYKGQCTQSSIYIEALDGSDDDKYTYTVIRVLSGAKKGVVARVIGSAGGLLTLEEVTGLSGEQVVELLQVGKFPRACDVYKLDRAVYKLIPLDIEHSVKLQTKFIYEESLKSSNIFTEAGIYESESIGDDYSYRAGSNGIKAKINPMRLVSPEAIPFIKKYIKK